MSKLLFDADTIRSASHPLSQLIRRIGYGRNITLDKYIALHSAASRRQKLDPNNLTSNRNNIRKSVLRDDLTFKSFWTFICDILGLWIVEMTITVKDPNTNEVYTYSTLDEPADKPGQAVQTKSPQGRNSAPV